MKDRGLRVYISPKEGCIIEQIITFPDLLAYIRAHFVVLRIEKLHGRTVILDQNAVKGMLMLFAWPRAGNRTVSIDKAKQK